MNKGKNRDFILLQKLLSVDLFESSKDDIYRTVQKLNKSKRQQVLLVCGRALKNKKIGLCENDMFRIAFIRIIVGAAPHSVKMMRQLMTNRVDRNAYEIHFTLFCYLGWMPNAKKVCSLMLPHIRNYLVCVKYSTAHAAWMAGVLLGEDWPLRKTLPILMQVVKQARYVAGRAAAVNGLEHALTNKGLTRAQRNNIFSVLQDIAKSDRSAQLKMQVMLILGDKAKKQRETLSLLKHITKSDKSNSVRQMAEYILEERSKKAPPKSKA